MGDDDRRADIEAEAVDVVAEFLHKIVGVLSRAGLLDRVLDVRGDDEGPTGYTRVRNDELARLMLAAGRDQWQGARSSPCEDHEAGIEAARNAVWKMSDMDTAAAWPVADAAVAAYLSHASPSRDARGDDEATYPPDRLTAGEAPRPAEWEAWQSRSPQGEDHEAHVGRIVRFLVDAGCEAAAAMVEIEFGRPPSE